MANEVWLRPDKGGNKVRLVDSRQVDITELVNHSIRVTLQQQIEKVIGRVILADSTGNIIPIMEVLGTKQKAKTSVFSCPVTPYKIAGIGVGSAYTSGDAMGTIAIVKVPKSGIIYSANLLDADDEGLQIDLEIFIDNPSQTADNSAWAPTDEDMEGFLTELNFTSFDDHGVFQTSEVYNYGKAYVAPTGLFYIQAVARGAHNIASSKEPRYQIFILSDDPDWRD